MRYFKEKVGTNGAEAIFYIQESSPEIDMDRKFPVLITVPGGAYMWKASRLRQNILQRASRQW